MDDPRAFLARLYHAAVAEADPARVMAAHMPLPCKGRTAVIAFGKAAVPMAAAWAQLSPDVPSAALVVAPDVAGAPSGWEAIRAGHPVPDAGSFLAAERALALAASLGPGDRLVTLVSGGGSSLLSAPAIPPEDKQEVGRQLLACGASIREMNAVRKHLSRIKGGRLAAAAHPAEVISFVLSDIPGDDLALVASGPTIPDRAGIETAHAVVGRYRLRLPETAMSFLSRPSAACPVPDDPAFAADRVIPVGTAVASLRAAARAARSEGIPAFILSDRIEGEARQAGGMHAAVVHQMMTDDSPFPRPCVILSGGETTVTLQQKGKGGRNGEFALGLALGIEGVSSVHALAADTDGRDGSETNAGAYCDSSSVARILGAGINPRAALDANDSYSAFAAAGDLFITGPTGTNVNDFRAIYVA